ncbi:hypothetical protein K440DRAFT_615524 [Wilcoxina mikolae CBS 423.85]|nr:hypothetical protein K440DRAFT_615524 [Wilcoxina mikolae CBS 423.85]
MQSTSRHESLPTRIAVPPTSLELLTQSSQLQQQQLQHSPPSGPEQPFGVTPTTSFQDVNSSNSLHQSDPAFTTIITATGEHNVPTPNSPPESDPQLNASPLAAQITPTLSILSITVLVQSGARHSFVLDRGYLERHSVKSNMGLLSDPLEMSVLQLKECIWKDWREDWDQRPASALFIKLIQFGAYLQDSYPLKGSRHSRSLLALTSTNDLPSW